MLMTEAAIRERFDPEVEGGGWQFATYEQMAPDGETVLGSVGMLCCPICGVGVIAPTEEMIKGRPQLDWPLVHIEYHVSILKAMLEMLGEPSA